MSSRLLVLLAVIAGFFVGRASVLPVAGGESLAGLPAAADEPRPVKDLTQALTYAMSPDPDECIRGLKALPKFAPAQRDKYVEEAVSRAFRRPEPEVRIAVCEAAGELINSAPEYRGSADFYRALEDPDKAVRKAALAGLSRALSSGGLRHQSDGGSHNWQEIHALVRLLKDEDPDIRSWVYSHLGKAADKAVLLPAYDPVVGVAEAIIEKLDTEPVSDNPDADPTGLLVQVVSALGRVGKRSPGAVPALLKVYARFPADTKRDAGMRGAVIGALAKIGPYSDKALPFLAELMRDEKLPIQERSWAAWAIGYFGPPAADLVPEMIALLRQALKHPDPPVGTLGGIIGAFGWLGETAEPAIPLLLELAQGPEDAQATERAIRALGYMGPVARKGAAPILTKLYFIKGGHRQDHGLFNALIQFQEAATPHILDVLKNGEPLQQYKAINLLRWLGPSARDAIPELKRIAADEKNKLRDAAQAALRDIER